MKLPTHGSIVGRNRTCQLSAYAHTVRLSRLGHIDANGYPCLGCSGETYGEPPSSADWGDGMRGLKLE